MTTLKEFQTSLGYRFTDQRLLHRALTHRSYLNEHPDNAVEDNERLEFLGDAVLDLVTSEMLYNRYPEMAEGRMTSMRAALVRTETLARLASYLGLGDALFLGRGEEENGGRSRPAILCSTLEAVLGAVFLEAGLDAVSKIVIPHFAPAADAILSRKMDRDPKSRLQEWSQAVLGHTPRYETIGQTGPDHDKRFTVQVLIDGRPFGRGTGRSKQSAAQVAADNALDRIPDGPED